MTTDYNYRFDRETLGFERLATEMRTAAQDISPADLRAWRTHCVAILKDALLRRGVNLLSFGFKLFSFGIGEAKQALHATAHNRLSKHLRTRTTKGVSAIENTAKTTGSCSSS